MPLLYLPEPERLFSWGANPAASGGRLPALLGAAARVQLITPEGRRDVDGHDLPLLETSAQLAIVSASELPQLPASVAAWVYASKSALELVSRERVVPTIARRGGRIEARWAAALSAGEDALRVSAIARSMPPAAHAVPVAADGGSELEVWTADALLRAYLDAVVDALVRASQGAPKLERVAPGVWAQRWRAALSGSERSFAADGFGERTLVDDLERWSQAALGARDRLRACFRLELPAADGDSFGLRFLLQAPDDPSLLVDASEVWKTSTRTLQALGRAFRDPQDALLEALGRAAQLFAPIARALEDARPEALALDAAEAWAFLGDGAPQLGAAGFGVIVPSELTAAGQRRLRLRMRIGEGKTKASKVAGAVAGAAGLGLDALLTVDWEAVIGDSALSAEELAALARHKAPLVRHRGAWVAIDPRELGEIQQRMAAGRSQLRMRDAVVAALSGETQHGQLAVVVASGGEFARLLERLRGSAADELPAPELLQATLRPYQARGLGWLASMSALGLGACLADDMGLGKTVQLLALLLWRVQQHASDTRPALLVTPTSVIGNWEREIERFAPSLSVTRHYGSATARREQAFPEHAGSLVVTSYGVLRRDAERLASVDWSVVALDEAQNIKNAASATAQAARSLRASHRFALTGTPVENRLAELWSILEFANPGLLGPLEKFRREFAVPVERYQNAAAAARLQRIVSPFVLRRLKSDRAIIRDLPAKNEMKVVCTLTREQATLYKAVVDAEMNGIESAQGIDRRGRVLALLSFLKQICNHPAQYLSERGPLKDRSGKLERITEMLEEAMAAGDKALVFTQFREMGERLLQHLSAALGCEVLFLHGGTRKQARDEMVQRFQTEPYGPRVFVLSLKAGGTGLNLTAANHVFHFDRWWNPAVEEQATDRAYRIGQQRAVQVHKLMCAGSVEEKIDQLLEHKRALAATVVGSGERWITELDDGALRELFALSRGAVVTGDEDAAPTKPQRKRAKAQQTAP